MGNTFATVAFPELSESLFHRTTGNQVSLKLCFLACYIPCFLFQRFFARPSQRTNRETVLHVRLNIPLVARYIRVYPLKWLVAPCMRVEFYGCEPGKYPKNNYFLLA